MDYDTYQDLNRTDSADTAYSSIIPDYSNILRFTEICVINAFSYIIMLICLFTKENICVTSSLLSLNDVVLAKRIFTKWTQLMA